MFFFSVNYSTVILLLLMLEFLNFLCGYVKHLRLLHSQILLPFCLAPSSVPTGAMKSEYILRIFKLYLTDFGKWNICWW